MDWNLRTCARRGHVTYRPDESDLAERLNVVTPEGIAWRCLRCGTFVLGDAHAGGPAQDAPIVPRGSVLRDAVLLKVLAAERALRGIGLLATAALVVRFRDEGPRLRQALADELPVIQPLADQLGWNVEGSWVVRTLESAFSLAPRTLLLVALGVALYGVLQLVEAYGLWRMRRWGEYLTVVATSLFIPLELREVIDHATALRVGLLLVNIAAVVWLVWSKRLFGVRGGGAAFHAERHQESLLTVTAATQ